VSLVRYIYQETFNMQTILEEKTLFFKDFHNLQVKQQIKLFLLQ